MTIRIIVISNPEDAMLKLANYLVEKRLKLVDMLKILNSQNTVSIDKNEFCRRLKVNFYYAFVILSTYLFKNDCTI